MNDLKNALIGTDMTVATFIAAMFFSLIGFVVYKKISYNKKGKRNPATPEKFDIWFWLRDNVDDIIVQFVILFCLVRFAPLIVVTIYPDSKDIFTRIDVMAVYALLGFFSTQIIAKAKKLSSKIK